MQFEALFVPTDVREATGERAWLQAMLDFEAGLAAAQARAGLIPEEAAREIGAACVAEAFDPETIALAGRETGTPAAALVSALRDAVGAEVARHVHRGATSQDVMDTAAVLVARRALEPIRAELDGVAAACAALASEHRGTLMAARTLLQQALPTTFGLKAAGWLVAVDEARDLLDGVALEVELGGAAGTLASLGDDGLRVLSFLAAELELGEPVLPWHTRRLRIGELGAALALTAGALEKIALDVKLMAQTEVGEVAELAAGGRGGSSTLPHKRNPVGAALAIACAHGARGAASVLIGALAQEHERAAGAWQAEWEALSRALALAGGAAAGVRESLEGLEVRPERMRANLEMTGGLVLAESVASVLGSADAKRIVGEAARRAASSGRPLRDELIDDPAVELSAEEIDRALDPAAYLGSAEAFVERALEAHSEREEDE
ncbi:MAG: 3-carboxy-cis,cis-muconate cycloisomerase [Thermoleophilaceae bacterium]|nr:3-carboxy-cis,cis-muconate cycloisomerase [Thermoleophilaceae bacterium]